MERNIPHVIDVFNCSPGARRRLRASQQAQKPADGGEDVVKISKYFEYLNEDDIGGGGSSSRKKKKTNLGKESPGKENNAKANETNLNQTNESKNKKSDADDESPSSKSEKNIHHIEKHLSMKKTIRKKMMRDLQQAFVEDPDEFQQDPKTMAPEKKNIINISNLSMAKTNISKSEHNFLDMLKDENAKEKEKRGKFFDYISKDVMNNNKTSNNRSGNESTSREINKAKSKEDLSSSRDAIKEEKKGGFWWKLTGKGKNKR